MQRRGWACMPLPPRLCVGRDFPVGLRASFQLCRVTRDHERRKKLTFKLTCKRDTYTTPACMHAKLARLGGSPSKVPIYSSNH